MSFDTSVKPSLITRFRSVLMAIAIGISMILLVFSFGYRSEDGNFWCRNCYVKSWQDRSSLFHWEYSFNEILTRTNFSNRIEREFGPCKEHSWEGQNGGGRIGLLGAFLWNGRRPYLEQHLDYNGFLDRLESKDKDFYRRFLSDSILLFKDEDNDSQGVSICQEALVRLGVSSRSKFESGKSWWASETSRLHSRLPETGIE